MALRHDQDAAFLLVQTLEMILKLTGEVYSILKAILEEQEKFDGDMFTLCTLAVDNGLINTASTLLAILGTITEAKLTLGSDGSVVIEGESFVQAATKEAKKISTPTPAVKQAKLVFQTIKLVPSATGVIRKFTTSIIKFTKKKEKKLEEL